MKRDLQGMAGRTHDLAVVGGGIYGACVAREAARRGLTVGLLEGRDFGHATSANSLRVVHGGLRYLQHGDLRRMRDSIRERRTLLDLAPHLVAPLPFAIPVYGHGPRGKAAHAAALAIADLVGLGLNGSDDPGRRIPRGRVVSRAELLRLAPGLPAVGVTGGALWHDAQVRSSERLLIAFLESACRAGARLANHAEVVGYLREGRRVSGVVARDQLTGDEVEIPARIVVNAAGPWADAALRPLADLAAEPRFLTSKGFNLLTRQILPDRELGIPGPARFRDRDAWVHKGRRLFFIVPWRGYSLLGTRHLPYDGSPEGFRITRGDVRLFLDEVAEAYPPATLDERDVLAVYGGLLPRSPGSPPDGEVELLKRSRVIDHGREDGVPGLISLVGTKWTTARAVAERAVRLAAERLGRPAGSHAPGPPLPGGDVSPFGEWLASKRASRPAAAPEDALVHLLANHGSGYAEVLRLAAEDPSLAEPLREGSPVIGAEVVHAVRMEAAMRLDDVVSRRTELALGGAPGDRALESCAALMARELNWDAARTGRELEHARDALRRRLPWGDESPPGNRRREGSPAPGQHMAQAM
ncbi:MAG TPA: glycerol-3-phosphate dehydrogenase/oxidase [Gemmatimonadota bacterium]